MARVLDAGPTVATVFVRALLRDWTLNLHSLLEFRETKQSDTCESLVQFVFLWGWSRIVRHVEYRLYPRFDGLKLSIFDAKQWLPLRGEVSPLRSV